MNSVTSYPWPTAATIPWTTERNYSSFLLLAGIYPPKFLEIIIKKKIIFFLSVLFSYFLCVRLRSGPTGSSARELLLLSGGYKWLVGEEGSGPIAVPLILSRPPRRQLFLPFLSPCEITCCTLRAERERQQSCCLLNCDVRQSIDCNSKRASTCCNKTIKQGEKVYQLFDLIYALQFPMIHYLQPYNLIISPAHTIAQFPNREK